MSRVSTYLNFSRSTEQAFAFYRSVFGGEFAGPIHRFGEVPAAPGQPPLAEADKNLVMHVALPILGGHVLMGTDAPASMGFSLTQGNSVYINLEPDTRAETDRLFGALSANRKVELRPDSGTDAEEERLLRVHPRSPLQAMTSGRRSRPWSPISFDPASPAERP